MPPSKTTTWKGSTTYWKTGCHARFESFSSIPLSKGMDEDGTSVTVPRHLANAMLALQGISLRPKGEPYEPTLAGNTGTDLCSSSSHSRSHGRPRLGQGQG